MKIDELALQRYHRKMEWANGWIGRSSVLFEEINILYRLLKIQLFEGINHYNQLLAFHL